MRHSHHFRCPVANLHAVCQLWNASLRRVLSVRLTIDDLRIQNDTIIIIAHSTSIHAPERHMQASTPTCTTCQVGTHQHPCWLVCGAQRHVVGAWQLASPDASLLPAPLTATNAFLSEPPAGVARFTHRTYWITPYLFQQIGVILVWLFAVPGLAFMRPFTSYRTGSYNNVVPLVPISRARYAMHLVGRLATWVLLWGWPWWAFCPATGATAASASHSGFAVRPWHYKALAFSLVPHMIFSLCFMVWSQVSHNTPTACDAESTNWYRHQVATSHNVAPGSIVTFFLSGGLSLQIEHHLFPTVNHWHLRKLQPIIQSICQKHGVEYRYSPSIFDALRLLWKNLGILSVHHHH